MSDVSESLRSLTKNEQFAQVAHQNERMSNSLIFLSKLLICSFLGKKQAIRSETDEEIPSPAFFMWHLCQPNFKKYLLKLFIMPRLTTI